MSSILQKFLIMFESQGSKEVKESSEKVENSMRKVGDAFKDAAHEVKNALLAFVSVAAVLEGFRSAHETVSQMDELSRVLGINIEKLSVWSDAVTEMGGSSQEFEGSVRSLTAQLSNFAAKGTSLIAPFFRELGIQMTDAHGRARSVFDILPEVADSFQKMSKSESLGIGEKMGLDLHTILLLQQGRRAVDDILAKQKDLGVITKQDAEVTKKFNEQWENTSHAFRSVFVAAESVLLPIFTDILEGLQAFAAFLGRHTNLITGSLILIGSAALYLAASFAPIILTTAAIIAIGAAFLLAYDDIKTFYEGGDSIIGKMVQRWPILGKVLNGIATVVKTEIGLFKDLIDIIIYLTETTIKSIETIVGAFDKVKGVFEKIFGGKSTTHVINAVNTGKNALNMASTTPLNSSMTNQTSNKNVSVQTGNIIIQTQATDAEGIASVFNDHLQSQMNKTMGNFTDGVVI